MNATAAAPLFDASDLLHTYSRAQAIEDGVLVDFDARFPGLAREAGLRFPIAVTAAAWAAAVAMTPAARRAGCDEKGRAWDLVWMLANAIRRGRSTASDRLPFSLYAVQSRARASLLHLEAVCGPGDSPAPVLTVGLPGED